MKRIWICCFSFIATLAFGQDNSQTTVKKPKYQRYGLRIGADISKIGRSIFDNNYKGLELVADYRFNHNIYVAAELGYENKNTHTPQLQYTSQGTFLKVGLDYNTYQNWLDMQNQIFVGFRYATSICNQNLQQYSIYYNTNGFFNQHDLITANREYTGINAHWIELVAGLKVEVLHNLFAGFKIGLYYKLAATELDNFENLYIPAFGRTYQGSNLGIGFNYTISYLIPFKRI